MPCCLSLVSWLAPDLFRRRSPAYSSSPGSSQGGGPAKYGHLARQSEGLAPLFAARQVPSDCLAGVLVGREGVR